MMRRSPHRAISQEGAAALARFDARVRSILEIHEYRLVNDLLYRLRVFDEIEEQEEKGLRQR